MLLVKIWLLVAMLALSACTSQPGVEADDARPVGPEEVVAPNTLSDVADAEGTEAADTSADASESAAEPSSNAAHHAERPSEGPTIDRMAVAPGAAPAKGPTAGNVREVTIPAGTTLTLRLGTAVSSRDSGVEDAINATLQREVVVNGVTAIPEGAAVSGVVTEAVRSGRVKGLARVGMRFTTLRAGSERYNIRTAVVSRDARPTKKEDATKIGIGAGAGAVAGAIAGGKKGAAIGTAVGAGGGTAAVLATRGDEVELPRGTVVTTRLTQPLTVRVPSAR